MIRIKTSSGIIKEIEIRHWSWFRNILLKNWIVKMKNDKEDIFLSIFFEDRNSFNTWYDIKKDESVISWFKKQEDSKFNQFKELIIGDVSTLRNIKKRLDKNEILKSKSAVVKMKSYFEGQYDEFRSDQSIWGGAQLIKELGITVCPYCNRNFIDTYMFEANKNKIKSNAQLDHFYPKEKYPFFSVSLYNLIPCCYACNHVKSNSSNHIVHPFTEDYENDAKFSTTFITDNSERSYDVNYLYGNSDNFKLVLNVDDSDPKKEILIRNSIEAFQIIELYDLNRDYVKELIKKAIIYNESRINELYNNYTNLFQNREEVVQMIMGNYLNSSDLDKRPLSKLTKDICEEIGLI